MGDAVLMITFKTPRGLLHTPPLTVEVWSAQGGGCAGVFQTYYSIQASWVERGASWINITAPLDTLSRRLVDARGSHVLVAKHNGLRQLYIVTETNITYSRTARIAQAEITGAGVWDWMNGQIRGPGGVPLYNQKISWSGGLNDLLRDCLHGFSVVRPDNSPTFNPKVHVTGEFDSLGELLLSAVENTDAWIDFKVKLPTETGEQNPYVVPVVRKYRGHVQHEDINSRRPQLDAPEAESWSFTVTRPDATTVVAGADYSLNMDEHSWEYETFTQDDARYQPLSQWAERTTYTDYSMDTETYTAVVAGEDGLTEEQKQRKVIKDTEKGRAKGLLQRLAGGQEVAASMAPTWLREFGSDGQTTLQYRIGDVFDSSLPAFPGELNSDYNTTGELTNSYFMPTVVTQVIVELGASNTSQYSVTPTVGLPDKWFADATHLYYPST